MRMMRRTVLATLLLMSAAAAESPAQELVDGSNPSRILEFAQGIGSAKLGADVDGDPEIAGQVDNQKYKINFFGCADALPCSSIKLVTSWKFKNGAVTQDEVNAFNRYGQLVKAYLQGEDEVAISMVVLLQHGVSVDNMKEWFGWWSFHVGEFDDEVINN